MSDSRASMITAHAAVESVVPSGRRHCAGILFPGFVGRRSGVDQDLDHLNVDQHVHDHEYHDKYDDPANNHGASNNNHDGPPAPSHDGSSADGRDVGTVPASPPRHVRGRVPIDRHDPLLYRDRGELSRLFRQATQMSGRVRVLSDHRRHRKRQGHVPYTDRTRRRLRLIDANGSAP